MKFIHHYLFQLITAALNDLVDGINEQKKTLHQKLAALHVVYFHNQEKMVWFGQLVSYNPRILEPLLHKLASNCDEMVCKNLSTFVDQYSIC